LFSFVFGGLGIGDNEIGNERGYQERRHNGNGQNQGRIQYRPQRITPGRGGVRSGQGGEDEQVYDGLSAVEGQWNGKCFFQESLNEKKDLIFLLGRRPVVGALLVAAVQSN
jgi:hypothetical protein